MSTVVAFHQVVLSTAGRVVLQVPQLQVQAGERVAIVGPNGAGKSTLLKLISALITPQQGRIEVLGRTVSDSGKLLPGHPGAAQRRALRKEVGFLMQGLHLVPRLTARENVIIGALGRLRKGQVLRSWLRWYPAALVVEADAALAALGLSQQAQQRMDQLSGGERQKVALARVQLQRPRLLLADEPTSALDPSAAPQVCHALRSVVIESGQTLLTVLHDLSLLPLLADRVIGISDGRLEWDLPLAQVTEDRLQGLYQRHHAPATTTPQHLHP